MIPTTCQKIDDSQEMDYELMLVNDISKACKEIRKTQKRIHALEDLLYYTRWPLGQRKKPSELKAARIELRQQQYYYKHMMSEHTNLSNKHLELLDLQILS